MARPNESRERILSAAEVEFAENGYFPASMDAIAERARVAKGTLYYNFQSKDTLFVEVVSRGLRYLTELLRDAAEAAEPIGRRLGRMLELQVSMLYRYPKIAAILFSEMSSGLDDSVRERIAEVRTGYEKYLESLIADGIAEGVIVDCDAELAAVTLIDTVYSACNHAMRSGRPQEHAYGFLSALLTGGMLAVETSEVPR